MTPERTCVCHSWSIPLCPPNSLLTSEPHFCPIRQGECNCLCFTDEETEAQSDFLCNTQQLKHRMKDENRGISALTRFRTCLEGPVQSRWWHSRRFFFLFCSGNPPNPIFHCFGQDVSPLIPSRDLRHHYIWPFPDAPGLTGFLERG